MRGNLDVAEQWLSTRPRDLPYGEAGRGGVAQAPMALPGARNARASRSPSRSASCRRGRGVHLSGAAGVVAADAALVEPAPTAVLGIDEARCGKPRWEGEAMTERWRHRWDTAFTDLAGDQGCWARSRAGRRSPCGRLAHSPDTGVPGRNQVHGDRTAAVYPSAITADLLPNAS